MSACGGWKGALCGLCIKPPRRSSLGGPQTLALPSLPLLYRMRHRALATLHLLLTAFRGVVAGTLAGARVPLNPSGLDAAVAAATTAGEAREARCAALLVAWDAADAVLSARGGRLGDGDSATREYLQAYRSWRASPALARW